MNLHRTYLTTIGLAVGLVAAIGCGSTALEPGDIQPDAGRPSGSGGARADTGATPTPTPIPTPTPLTPPWVGAYQTNATWDLSGPINAQRSLGAVVADMVVDEIVARSGVPGPLQDRARDVVSDLIRAKVIALVNDAAPARLKPDSDFMRRLGTVLASVNVASDVQLASSARPTAVRGTEEFQTFTFNRQGLIFTAPVGQVLALAPGAHLTADWRGDEQSERLEIAPHDVALRLGQLALWVAEHVLAESDIPTSGLAAASAVNCMLITVTALDNKQSLSFGVGGASFSIGFETLFAGCGSVRNVVKDRALGLFDIETGVRLGGPVTWTDSTGDQHADVINGQFNGPATDKGGALAPQVAARFQGARR